ncbi:MAG: helix-turn-helix transcriptional regulator [candidate division WOR-3 bacterium]
MRRTVAEKSRRFALFPDFGRRLAELRMRRGMRQSDVVRRMSAHTSQSLVSQLETGRLKNPTLGLLSSYLQAIGASWSEIADLLDRSQSQPETAESDVKQEIASSLANLPRQTAMAVGRYDLAVARVRQARGKPPEPAELRTMRAMKLAAAHERRRRLLETVRRGTDRQEFGPGLSTVQRAHLLTLAQKLWGILCRTRQRNTTRREALLDETVQWFRSQEVLPEAAIEWTRQTVIDFFTELERRGQLDRLPRRSAEKKKQGMRRYRQQQLQEHRHRVNEYQKARSAVIAKLWSAAEQKLAQREIRKEAYPQFLSLIRRICYAIDCFDNSETQQQEIENYLTDLARHQQGSESELARRIAKTVASRYRQLRASLPPNPLSC